MDRYSMLHNVATSKNNQKNENIHGFLNDCTENLNIAF